MTRKGNMLNDLSGVTIFYRSKDECLCADCASKWGGDHNLIMLISTHTERPLFDCDMCKKVEKAYWESCEGIEISMWDLVKVFDEGKKALRDGRDLKTSLREFVETIRTD